jgi:D-alanyl-D-alanine carboxypeptidase
MKSLRSEAPRGLRLFVIGVAVTATALTINSHAADARHHHRLRVHHAYVHHVRVRHASSGEGYSPPSASIIVDGNTGQILEATNPDALRHPASLTKVMTLYLLFERLDAGTIRLDTPLTVSAHAAAQDPTKLNLRPGSTIAVDDAIKGIVTRSANDAAVVIAENLGGSEEDFAHMMTQKARALGMSRTTYVNASGLPDDDQITTARDQALLGRAIQERFPRYYRYFSTPAFVYHGETIRNHDHLLGQVEGVDGIKTGFTRASGFNLITSLHRDGRFLVGVVMGGRSAFQRDAHMRELLGQHFQEASLRHSAPVVAEQAPHEQIAQREQVVQRDVTPPREAMPQRAPAQSAAFAKTVMAGHAEAAPAPARSARVTAGSSDPIQPLLVKTISYRIASVKTAPLAPMPPLVASQQAPAAEPAPSRPQPATAAAEAAPRGDLQVAMPSRGSAPSTRMEVASADPRGETLPPEPAAPQSHAHSGWLIQIGAFDGEQDAKQHLSAAQTRLHSMLAAADPFTERVQKGDKALYRARFAGFDKAAAEAACRELKRNDFDCMALKD